jgi:hypothetical protein
MAKISINDQYVVNGRFTVKRYQDNNGNIKVIGTLATHFYFEEINKIENYRYSITGIDVKEESFGSDDFDIVYSFEAESLTNKCGVSDLTNDVIDKIEKEIYSKNGYITGTELSKIEDGDKHE